MPSSKDFDPLVDLHLLEVLLRVHFAFLFHLSWPKKLASIGRIAFHCSLSRTYLINLIHLFRIVALGCWIGSSWHLLSLASILH